MLRQSLTGRGGWLCAGRRSNRSRSDLKVSDRPGADGQRHRQTFPEPVVRRPLRVFSIAPLLLRVAALGIPCVPGGAGHRAFFVTRNMSPPHDRRLLDGVQDQRCMTQVGRDGSGRCNFRECFFFLTLETIRTYGAGVAAGSLRFLIPLQWVPLDCYPMRKDTK